MVIGTEWMDLTSGYFAAVISVYFGVYWTGEEILVP